ncbi:stage IV sporulation protein FB [Virgibacillus profundi]|uniref:Stage IV sporulation protein FB n=1 Tax=Virgibacillus profundi TaxID=2024555 RepID=A0A2A2I8K2_9BACI|nr:M50 family metallopeptidase [Virgibacillus profundi]PAV27614.1 stage IV sporulation protein FB [Virgibacillus profundi]PXY51792.1 stage IV sporulation protein FB [Virgibacillus profundi]
MTFHKYLPKIHIHPVLMIFIGISLITGTFMELSIIIAIVLFHELGHFIMAKFFDWRIKSIMLWVFGGVMDTDEHGNRPLREEALVTIAGPFQHMIIYIILYFSTHVEIFPLSVVELIFYYNTAILIFNLLPIWPLDGGKLLFLCLSGYFPYKKAYHSVIIFSMITCLLLLLVQLFLFPFTLSAFFIMLFLFMENRSDWKQRYYVFIRFLLKRYEGNAPIKDVHPVNVLAENTLMDVFNTFMREKKHSIYITFPDNQRKSIDEADCLRSYFHDKHYDKTVGEVFNYIN